MSRSALRACAPAKVNLCLFLGPTRPDGYHELVSVLQPVTIFDSIKVLVGAAAQDQVICEGVPGDNLALRAIAAYRGMTGWDGPSLRITITKRIPIAAGMGGGSSDAAAVLRLASRLAARDDDDELRAIAATLGADVPAMLNAGPSLATGFGERVHPLEPARSPLLAIVAPTTKLATPDVFREADRLGIVRSAQQLESLTRSVRASWDATSALDARLMVNDLEAAAISLCPPIQQELDRLGEHGARRVMVSGSGPTVFGVFDRREGDAHARDRLATELRKDYGDRAIVAEAMTSEARSR